MSDRIDEIIEMTLSRMGKSSRDDEISAVARAAFRAGEDLHTQRVFKNWLKEVAEQRAEFDKIAREKFARELLQLFPDKTVGGHFADILDRLRKEAGGVSSRKPCDLPCHACIEEFDLRHPTLPRLSLSRYGLLVCQKCGNKRCPHASDHRLECTNSNKPGQPGSVYE